MSQFALTCCSTADRTKAFFDSRAIAYACFHWQEHGVDHLDDLYQSITPDEFYANIAAGAQPTTSQVSVGEFIELWTPFLEAGRDVLHISLSSGISGEFESASMAAKQLSEQFPERKIIALDSLAASSGYGMLVEYVADKRDEGASIDECCQWVLDNRLRVNHWFFSTDLTSYVRGGRVSPVSGFVGNLLKICPVLNVNSEGKLILREKIRKKKFARQTIVQHMIDMADDSGMYAGKCLISQSACRADAQTIADTIEAMFPNLKGKVEINDIGTVIGSHTGPGTVALFFMGEERSL